MKVYLSNYRNHWISPYTILDYMFFWTDWSKCSRRKDFVPDGEFIDNPKWVEKVIPYLDPISKVIQIVLDKIHPSINYVKLDPWDTWSMDHTLSHIILPMLIQLKNKDMGSGFVYDEDVPEAIRSTNAKPKNHEWDTDEFFDKRWNYVLDEMIWAFTQKTDDNNEDEFFDHSAYGDTDPNYHKSLDDLITGKSKVKIDWEGLQNHSARKSNGFRLFGKYYEGLWE